MTLPVPRSPTSTCWSYTLLTHCPSFTGNSSDASGTNFHRTYPLEPDDALAPFLIAAVTVPDWFARRAELQGKAHRESVGAMSADVIDYIQGMREVVAFGAVKLSMDRLDVSQQKYSDTYVAYESRSGMERGAGDALLAGGMVVTVALGGWLSIMGYMDVALYPVAAVLTAMAFSPVMHLLSIARQLSQTAAAADRVFGIMNTQPSVIDLVSSSPEGPIIPKVCFEDTRFRYGPELPEVLKGVNLTVSPGETVALVGPSGAGSQPALICYSGYGTLLKARSRLAGTTCVSSPRSTSEI